MAGQWTEDSGDAVRFPHTFPGEISDCCCTNNKVIPPSTGKEDRVPSNTKPTKGYCLKACTAARKSEHIPEAGS
jgi:hypothetical protein